MQWEKNTTKRTKMIITSSITVSPTLKTERTLQSGNVLKDLGAYALAGTKWFSNQLDGVVHFENIAYTYKVEMFEQNHYDHRKADRYARRCQS